MSALLSNPPCVLPCECSLTNSQFAWKRPVILKVQMYYGPELADTAEYVPGRVQTLHVHSRYGSTFLRELSSCQPCWMYDIILKIRLCQWTSIYLKNIPAEFHPKPTWNNNRFESNLRSLSWRVTACSLPSIDLYGTPVSWVKAYSAMLFHDQIRIAETRASVHVHCIAIVKDYIL